jgi:hypothetical protein
MSCERRFGVPLSILILPCTAFLSTPTSSAEPCVLGMAMHPSSGYFTRPGFVNFFSSMKKSLEVALFTNGQRSVQL